MLLDDLLQGNLQNFTVYYQSNLENTTSYYDLVSENSYQTYGPALRTLLLGILMPLERAILSSVTANRDKADMISVWKAKSRKIHPFCLN